MAFALEARYLVIPHRERAMHMTCTHDMHMPCTHRHALHTYPAALPLPLPLTLTLTLPLGGLRPATACSRGPSLPAACRPGLRQVGHI